MRTFLVAVVAAASVVGAVRMSAYLPDGQRPAAPRAVVYGDEDDAAVRCLLFSEKVTRCDRPYRLALNRV